MSITSATYGKNYKCGTTPALALCNPKYPHNVFGPEDGSIDQVKLRHCHRFVVIPTRHCVNLAAAVYMVLYDRLIKRQMLGLEPVLPMDDILAENRGWCAIEPEKILADE